MSVQKIVNQLQEIAKTQPNAAEQVAQMVGALTSGDPNRAMEALGSITTSSPEDVQIIAAAQAEIAAWGRQQEEPQPARALKRVRRRRRTQPAADEEEKPRRRRGLPPQVVQAMPYLVGIGGLLLLILLIYWFWHPISQWLSTVGTTTPAAPGSESGPSFREIPGVSLVLSFGALVLFAINLSSLIETASRGERLWLDWWGPSGLVVLMSIGSPLTQFETIEQLQLVQFVLWILACGVMLGAVVVSAVTNEVRRQGRWGHVDLSPVILLSSSLIVLHYAGWEYLPYPTYLPSPIFGATPLLVFASIFEIRKSKIPSLWGIGLGIAMTIILTQSVSAAIGFYGISMVILVFAISRAVYMGSIPMNKHDQALGTARAIPGDPTRKFQAIWPWDAFLLFNVTTGLLSMALRGGDFVIFG